MQVSNRVKIDEEINRVKTIDASNKNINKERLQEINDILQSTDHVIRIYFNNCNLDREKCYEVGNLLKSCSRIEGINLEGNRNMGSGIKNIFEGLVHSSNTLKDIDLSACGLNEQQGKEIIKLLKNCSRIERINLNNLYYYDLEENISKSILNELVRSSDNLKHLNIQSIILREEDFEDIGKLLRSCSKIETFNVGYNFCTNVDVLEKICEGLVYSINTLKHIDLEECGLRKQECQMIGNLLKSCSKIETINILGNEFLVDDLSNILCQSVNTLKHVYFDLCDLNEKQCKKIEYFFKSCSGIETIHVKCHGERNNGLLHICNGLFHSSNSLKNFNFSICQLTPEECRKIGSLFKSCSNIETINLAGNRIMGNGLEDICNGLIHSSNSLKNLNFCDCHLNEDECEKIGELLKSCSKIETINLAFNKYMKSGLKEICDGLILSAYTLKNINFRSCDLKEQQWKQVIFLLKRCSKIESISLQENKLSDNDLSQVFEQLYRFSKSLKMALLDCFMGKGKRAKEKENLLKHCDCIVLLQDCCRLRSSKTLLYFKSRRLWPQFYATRLGIVEDTN